MIREFALSEKFYMELRRRLLTQSVPLVILALAAGLYISNRAGSDWLVTAAAAVLLIPIMFVTFRRNIHLQRENWKTFRIVISDEGVTRVQRGHPDIVIAVREITRLKETLGYGLTVFSSEHHRRIFVPPLLQDYEECKNLLARWRPPELAHSTSAQAYAPVLAGLATTIALGVVMVSSNPSIVVPVGGLLLLGLLASLTYIQLSPHYERRIKRLSWTVLLVLLPIAARILSFW